ncbi:hypothetical protein C7293_12765 [filamentous cyanobacterium CCT1]|nr:hypothetical protein C7293_12765 [filamentous cyanobacterium CCT1]PSN80008.1 hypothetical protein C8B47_08685 [filamentous cyanobacterium CCP4]
MYQSDELLEAAKTIRPFLPDLLGQNAEEMDHQLAELITRCQAGEPQENQIAALLAHEAPTREWMAEFLSTDQALKGTRGWERLPGISAPGAPKYACPKGDYIWYRLDVSDLIPSCPTHKIPLELAETP